MLPISFTNLVHANTDFLLLILMSKGCFFDLHYSSATVTQAEGTPAISYITSSLFLVVPAFLFLSHKEDILGLKEDILVQEQGWAP